VLVRGGTRSPLPHGRVEQSDALAAVTEGGHGPWRVPEDGDALLGGGQPYMPPRQAKVRCHRL